VTALCGKGGVGKTTLSLACGLWYANSGERVVVVTSHPLKELAVGVSLHGLKEQHPQAADNLFVVHIDPREILNNKVKQQIPSDFLARTVLSSRLYQNLVEVAPGLKELAFLARLKQLAERQSVEGGAECYDRLIWDAPATGHFLQTLKVSKSFDTYMSGPFAILGRELFAFLSNPDAIRFLPVTILEEMAVDETIELCREMQKEIGVRPAGIICNLASPLLGSTDEQVRDLGEALASQASNAEELRFMLDRHIAEQGLFARLQSAVPAPFHIVRRISKWDTDVDLLLSIGGVLCTSLAGRAS
jgi:anion-transporting  ArsA/GET3 family ATPase